MNGKNPSSLDVDTFTKMKPHQSYLTGAYPHTLAWFGMVYRFSDALKAKWPKVGGTGATAGGDDDMDDLFGDDDGDGAQAAKEAAEKAKAQKKKKEKPPEMSLIIFEVKPLDDTTNLDDLAKRIFATKYDGLIWKSGDYKKEPVAFGIFKLILGFSCEDTKVSVDQVQEDIEAMSDMVQSVEIASFTKI